MRAFLSFLSLLILFSPLATFAKFPNDPLVSQWGFEDIGAYTAWDSAIGGSEVVVAVIDNGFDTTHPDLQANIWENVDEVAGDGVDNDKNGYVDDKFGWNFLDQNNDPRPSVSTLTEAEKKEGVFNHGTIVAGLIGAVGNNALYGAGINWNVKLMNLKVVGNEGSGDITPLSNAIRYAVDNGADVINISMVGDPTGEVYDAVKYAFQKKVAVIAAVGNGSVFLNASPRYPVCADSKESEDWILGVSAITKEHILAKFSSNGSDCVDITAPGVDIASTIVYEPSLGLSKGFKQGWNGTSFATPLVSGAAALIKSIQPLWGAKEIYQALLQTAHKTPTENEETYANYFGSGLLQIDTAVQYAIGQLPAAAPEPLSSSVSVFFSLSGKVSAKEKGKNLQKETLKQLKRIARTSTATSDGITYRVTFQKLSSKKGRITLSTKEWEKQSSFDVPLGGVVDLTSADLTGDGIDEIILAPQQKDTRLFLVYTLDGTLLAEEKRETAHSGVALSRVKSADGKRYELLVVFEETKDIMLERWSVGMAGATSLIEDMSLASSSGTFHKLIVMNADKDALNEYILALSYKGKSFWRLYDDDGSLLKEKIPYSGYDGALDLFSVDYDNDGDAEIAVLPVTGGKMVRVFTPTGKQIAQWWPFGAGKQGKIGFLHL